MPWTIWWKPLIFLWRSRQGIPFSSRMVASHVVVGQLVWIQILIWTLTKKSNLFFRGEEVHDIRITYCVSSNGFSVQHLTLFFCFTAFGTCADQVPEGQSGASLEPCGRGSLDSGPQSHQLSNLQCLWSMMLIPPSLPVFISFSLPAYYIHSFLYESISFSFPFKLLVFTFLTYHSIQHILQSQEPLPSTPSLTHITHHSLHTPSLCSAHKFITTCSGTHLTTHPSVTMQQAHI